MAREIEDILPEREVDANFDSATLLKSFVAEEEKRLNRKLNSAEIARIKLREIKAAKREAIYDGLEYKADFNRQDIELRAERRQEAIAASPDNIAFVAKEDAALVGASPKEITKLLASLNVNLNVRLTKTDTHNLLATLLTCNEKQLLALQANPKVPIAIKAVIVRLLADATLGNIATIERLWDRVFGANKLSNITETMPDSYNGLLPNVPVSREAYILIRETIIGKG